jgi:hypothetical protein
LVAGLVMMVGGAAMVWIAWLGSQHRLPRNGWAGIRIPSTMRSDQAWEAAHSAAAGGSPWPPPASTTPSATSRCSWP